MCHWYKHEHEYVIAPSVNRTLMIEPNCEKDILNFKLISFDENYSKLNISLTFGPKKFTKSFPRNPIHRGLCNHIKNLPQFLQEL
jgi:hypothetical protein